MADFEKIEHKNESQAPNLQDFLKILLENNKHLDKNKLNKTIKQLSKFEHEISNFKLAKNRLKIYLKAKSAVDANTLVNLERYLANYFKIFAVDFYIDFSEDVLKQDNFLASLLPWIAYDLMEANFAILSIILPQIKYESKAEDLYLTVDQSKSKIFTHENRELIASAYEERLGVEPNLYVKVSDAQSKSLRNFENKREDAFADIEKQAIAENILAEPEEGKYVRKIAEDGSVVAKRVGKQQKQPKKKKARKRRNSNNYYTARSTVYGRLDTRLELSDISSLDAESGRVSVTGKVAFYEAKLVSNNTRVLLKFDIQGQKSAIACILFLNDLEKEAEINQYIKDGVYVRADLDISYDAKYSKDLQGYVKGIKVVEAPEGRHDDAEVKRVELHMHTNMSERDGITKIKDLVQLADKFNMPALAITDHGNVQAYPEAHVELEKLRAKGSKMKLIYGEEIYLIDDGPAVAYGFKDLDLDDRYVALNIKTSGKENNKSRLLYAEAVSFLKNPETNSFEVEDTFSTYFNPEIDIDENTLKQLNISKEDIDLAPKSLEGLALLHDFMQDSAVVSMQGLDSLGFLRYEAYRTPKYDDPKLKFNPVFIDLKELINLSKEGQDIYDLNKAYGFNLSKDEDFFMPKLTGLVFNKIWSEFDYKPLRALNHDFGQVTLEKVREYKNKPYHAIVLVKDLLGLYNLYRLVSESHVRYFKSRPRMPKSLIKYLRQGLILGTSCEAGQILRRIRKIYIEAKGDFEEAKKLLKADLDIQEKSQFYNYLEVQPLGNNVFMLEKPDNYIDSVDDLINLNKLVIYLADLVGKPVVATCDAHFLNEEDVIYRQILQASSGYDPNENPTVLYLRNTNEMLEEFYYLPDDLAYEIVVTNTNKIADLVEPDLKPFPQGTYPPVVESAPSELREITWTACKEKYEFEGKIPELIEKRVNDELDAIINNGYSVMYYIALKLVKHTNDDGFIVGSRGSVGSSFVAYLCGITEVNPLEPHYICKNCNYIEFVDSNEYGSGFDLEAKTCPNCGAELSGDGQNIPFETFLGFNGGKEPDIDLNFSGEYQSRAFQFIIKMFGADYTFRAGTITSYAEKNAMGLVKNYVEKKGIFITKAEARRLASGLNGIKRSTGQHPGGIVIVPHDREIYDFTPIQYPANNVDASMTTTHIDFHSLDDAILKLDILGHDDPTLLKIMGDMTGVDTFKIPVPDPKVMKVFEGTEVLGIPKDTTEDNCGTLGLPEFGTLMARDMIKETKPRKFNDLLQLMGLSHGTDVWQNNAQDLIRNGTCTLEEVIGCRDDILLNLINWGIDSLKAFKIMEKVRKGKGLTADEEALMRENNVPDWYIESCKKIKYMFPRAHAAAYSISALRIAWFKVYRPEAFYATHFSVKADEFDYDYAKMSLGEITALRKKMRHNFNFLTDREQKIFYIIEIIEEMLLRGIKFVPIDIETANARLFKVVSKNEIMPALNTVKSISTAMAEKIVAAREDGNGKFENHEELQRRSGLGNAAIKALKDNHILDHIPESAQVSLFDMLG